MMYLIDSCIYIRFLVSAHSTKGLSLSTSKRVLDHVDFGLLDVPQLSQPRVRM